MHSDQGLTVGGCVLGEVIGRGGQGTVYRARQLGVDRQVAIKLVPVAHGDTAEIARFEREARVAGTLDHPHCLPIYAAGADQDLLYIVMRLVDGPNLAQLVDRSGPLAPERAVQITAQVASALDSAHKGGLVHRDLKPANILIDHLQQAEYAWVSDFGLMRGVDDRDQITQTGQWVGTPKYAAPEQRWGRDVGPGADIYALGGVLSFMLGPNPPPQMRPILMRALADDPADRFATATELAAAAELALTASDGRQQAAAATQPLPAPPLPDMTQPLPLADTQLQSTTQQPRPAVLHSSSKTVSNAKGSSGSTGSQSSGRSRGKVIGAGFALLCVASAVIAVVLVSGGQQPTGGSTGFHSAHLVTTRNFTANIPRGWVVSQPETTLSGYSRTVVRSPNSGTVVDIDRTAHSTATLNAHASSVEAAVASTTAGYQRVSQTTVTDGSRTTIVWSFTLPGADGKRVDVFRRVGSSIYAVLGKSDSLAASRRAATGVADTLKER